MKIGLQTWGSEGDVRPFVALAAGLAGAGHEPTLAVSEIRSKDFSAYGERFGFEIRPVGRLEMDDDRIKELAKQIFDDWNPIRQGGRLFEHLFNPMAEDMLVEAKRLCAENDLVIGHFFMHPLKIAAELSGKPLVTVYTAPIIPTADLPVAGTPNLGRGLNRLVWKVTDILVNKFWKPNSDAMFVREGLTPPRSMMRDLWDSGLLNLVASSPALFARPSDWPDRYELCGFFVVPGEGEPDPVPESLERFLSEGPPPVYYTFGSMLSSEPNPRQVTEILVAAALKSGRRAVIQSSWEELPGLGEHPDIYRAVRAPHARVFPRCAAVVHHGGAGTTHSAVLAGRPSVVVEHTSDQPFWAGLLYQAGLSPRPLHRKSVTPDKLARAVRCATDDPAMTARAEEAARRLAEEDGVGRAVKLIGRYSGLW